MKIRKFKSGDAKACSRIIYSCLDNMKMDKKFKKFLKEKDTPNGIIKTSKEADIFIYENNGKILGLGKLEDRKIGMMFIDIKNQRKGIGKAILIYLEKLAKKRGKRKVWLNSFIGATKFYKKFDYEKAGKRDRDAIKMEKLL